MGHDLIYTTGGRWMPDSLLAHYRVFCAKVIEV